MTNLKIAQSEASIIQALMNKNDVKYYAGFLPSLNSSSKDKKTPNSHNIILLIKKLCHCSADTLSLLSPTFFKKVLVEKNKLQLIDILRFYHQDKSFVQLEDKLNLIFSKNHLNTSVQKISNLLGFNPKMVHLEEFIQSVPDPEKVCQFLIETNIKKPLIDLLYHHSIIDQKALNKLLEFGIPQTKNRLNAEYLNKYYFILGQCLQKEPKLSVSLDLLQKLFPDTITHWHAKDNFVHNSVLSHVWEDYGISWDLNQQKPLYKLANFKETLSVIDPKKIVKLMLPLITLEQIKNLKERVIVESEFHSFIDKMLITKEKNLLEQEITPPSKKKAKLL